MLRLVCSCCPVLLGVALGMCAELWQPHGYSVAGLVVRDEFVMDFMRTVLLGSTCIMLSWFVSVWWFGSVGSFGQRCTQLGSQHQRVLLASIVSTLACTGRTSHGSISELACKGFFLVGYCLCLGCFKRAEFRVAIACKCNMRR
jgi:hypothetical protein